VAEKLWRGAATAGADKETPPAAAAADRTAALTPALKGRLKRKRPAKSPSTPARLGPMDNGGGGGGRGDAAMVATAPKAIRFSDLGGVEPAMQTIEEAVLFPLRHPEVYSWLGVEPPRGILLHGPPGYVRWELCPPELVLFVRRERGRSGEHLEC